MNNLEFWNIIDSVNINSKGDMDQKCILLKEHLTTLEKQELLDFTVFFEEADTNAYTWALWGAAYVMNGGCSDDSFSDFRATLISQGSEIYKEAITDPDSLAGHYTNEEDICYEGFQYVINDVAEETLGKIPDRSTPFPEDPAGEEWDESDLDRLYPKLSYKYSNQTEGFNSIPPNKPWWKFW